jgi:glycosyltransferase involved in cell wall biosynthesis
MKICFVSNYKKNGYGESTRPYYLSRNLLKQGHTILHLCDHAGYEDGIEYIKIDPWGWEPRFMKRLADFIRLSFKVRAFNPDVVYMHQFNSARWALASRTMRAKKFVFDAHTSVYFEAQYAKSKQQSEIERIKNAEQQVCLKADYIISASEETKNILQKSYSLPENKLFVVGNATNMQPVTEGEVAATKKNPDEFICTATLPFDGFFSNELALQYLFEIAAVVQARNEKIKFVVLGGGDKPVPPTANVIYKGYVPDLRKEVLQADICLMPYPDEAVCGGARNKFCDFVALGKVVVSSPEGMRGMQTLQDGKNCVVASDKFDYAEKIIALVESGGKLKAMEAEVLKVKNAFNWQDRALEINKIFKKILA